MVLCGFVFDVIVYNLKLRDADLKLERATCIATFLKGSTLLTYGSRLNVTEIPDKKGIVFEADTEKIARDMSDYPLQLVVNVGDNSIGSAVIEWPVDVLKKMGQMRESNLITSVYLFNEEEELEEDDEPSPVGSMDVWVRLLPKCKNIEEEDFAADFEEFKEEIMETLVPNDLFFVLAPDRNLEPCQGELVLEKDLPPQSMTLDMSRILPFNGQLVPTPSILNSCCNPDACGLRKQAKSYGAKDHSCGAIEMLSRGKKKSKPSCLICGNTGESSETESILSEFKDEDIPAMIWQEPKPMKVCLDQPPPELRVQHPIHPRTCPICLTQVDWLPAYTPCPKCGYKAVPHIQEMPYSHEVDAETILREFYFREQESDPIDCRAVVHRETDDTDDDELVEGAAFQNKTTRRACKGMFRDKFDFEKAKESVPEAPAYSKPLQEMFCQLRSVVDNLDIMGLQERQSRCMQILNDHEEKQAKFHILGKETFDHCLNLENIKKRMSRCKPLDKEEPCTPKPKHKKKKKQNCMCAAKRTEVFKKKNVPSKKGWLWNLAPQSKDGWRPGAVCRRVRNIMAFFLEDYPADTFSKKRMPCRVEPPPPKRPLLQVCKKNDLIAITLRAGDNCKANPMVFQIQKSDECKQLRSLRDDLLHKGYAKCTCLRPISECVCRPEAELTQLICSAIKQAACRKLADVEDKLVLNADYDSDGEYEFKFSPPVTTIKRKPKYRPNGVQFSSNDYVQVDKLSDPAKPILC